MNSTVLNYIKSGCSALYIVSHEESRVEADIAETAKGHGYQFHTWSVTEGITSYDSAGNASSIGDSQDPTGMLDLFLKLPEKSVILARDFHAFLGGPRESANPMTVRRLRDVIAIGKQTQRVIVILGCRLHLPPELEKEITVIEFRLPDRAQLETVLRGIGKSAGLTIKGSDVDPLVDAASGMTTMEAEAAFALSFAETGAITPAIIQREKSSTVKKNGLLEIIESRTRLEDIGGLDNLKRDLHEKRNLFRKEAKDYGLPTPRGLLVVGQPGTGKSLTASATSNIFGLPLLRLEAGRLFGSLVGESESNWRSAFATVKAVSPCILWIDEVDGLFSGSGQSTDGGTTQRVLKAILQDMQFNGDNVFFMFTANDIDQLPDPLIDRLDVWSVDLPNTSERRDIWRIHITKRGRKAKGFDLDELAKATEGFSGRQIEQVWLKAMTLAFNDGGREPMMDDCKEAASRVTPTSKTMASQIEARRKRLEGRATPASTPETTVVKTTGRKLAS